MPTREIFWNISEGWLIYPVLLLVPLLALGYGFWRHVRVWRRGKGAVSWTDWPERLRTVFSYAFGQARVVRSPFAGTMHLFLYSGFLVLFLGTLMIAVQEDLHVPFLQGNFYLFYSLVLDVFGLLALVGVAGLAYRRYVQRPANLDNRPDDGITLGLIALVLVSGYLVEGLRMGATEVAQHPDWAVWSPLGLLVAGAFGALGMDKTGFQAWHGPLWWLHALAASGLVVYFGWSKLSHAFTVQANALLRAPTPMGAMRPIMDFKNAQELGAGSFAELTVKQRVGADTCIHAGRCQDNCPAYVSGKPLNPKSLIVNLQAMSADARRHPSAEQADLLESALSEEGVWACTTCGACTYHCPVLVEPMDVIIDMRRRLVMRQGKLPEPAQMAMLNLQKRGHPWVGTRFTRTDWMDGLPVRQLSELDEGEQVEVLFWVGCSGALVERNITTTRTMARVLAEAGVNFAVLGDEETCTGDPARRLGNEFLFQQMAKKNVKTLNSYGVREVVATCPHCFNTLKNEYPQFGGDYAVVHHTEFLAQLVEKGRLRPSHELAWSISYHDSCYLGRYNDVYQPPRKILSAIPGTSQVEMPRCREKGFCCGAGGGHAFMEEKGSRRINHIRSEEALGTGAQVLASACPFCLQMFEEGLKATGGEKRMQALDVVELLEVGLKGQANGQERDDGGTDPGMRRRGDAEISGQKS